MKIAMATDIRQRIATFIDTRRELFADFRIALFLAGVIAAVTMFWFSFDYHFPNQDEAEHIMNSIAAKDLLRHCHPLSSHWWHQVLSINCYYPPAAYLVNGFFLLLFGTSRFTEQLSLTFFTGLMTVSIYGIVRLLSGGRLAACISACCIALYPLIIKLSHSFFLDLPEVAMTALALMTLLWWSQSPVPKWRRTILTGVIIGLACLTKQLVAAYLLPVALYFLVVYSGLAYPLKKPQWNWLVHMLTMGIITIGIGLPFLIINYAPTHNMTNMIMGDFAQKNIHWTYLDRLSLYLPLIPQIMSLWLMSMFFASCVFCIPFFSKPKQHFRLAPISLSALGGMFLMIAWPGNAVDPRYLAPVLIAPAIYTGFLLAKLLQSGRKWQQILAIFVMVVAVVNYVFVSFVPYPLFAPKLSWQSSESKSENNPVLPADWGHKLVIDTIQKIDGHNPVYLNILPNMATLHTHAFELFFKEAGITTIIPTTTRQFTVFGDKVKYSPQEALQYQWYLWKTGSVGYIFFD